MVWGLKWVAMARHGLILSQDGATRVRKVFKYLPDLRDTIKKQKWPTKPKNPELQNSRIFLYGVGGMGGTLLYWGSPWVWNN